MAEAQVRVTFIESVRGSSFMYNLGFKYRLNKEKNGRYYWRCAEPRCKISAITDGNLFTSVEQEHNHDATLFAMEVEAFKSKLTYRATTETTTIPRIYDDEISRLRKNADVVPDGFLRLIPTYRAMKTIMYRQRQKTMQRLPKTLDEIELPAKWRQTEAGERGSAPVSLVYCLLPNRKEETYVRTLTSVQNIAHEFGFRISPETFQIDFEVAAHNAVERVFLNSNIRGCFFHYTQSIWKAVQRCHLVADYKDDDEVKTLVRRASALPFVPLEKVEDVWLESISESHGGERVVRFMDYVTTQWIEGRVFTQEKWNHFKNAGRRTNNNLEGWHHKMNAVAGKSHPNIYEVINIIKREQSVTEVKVAPLDGIWRAPPRKSRYVHIDARIMLLKERLGDNVLDTMEYTYIVADLLHLE